MANNESNIVEEWRPVVGYEDAYSVSSLGRVRRDRGDSQGARVGRILKQSFNKSSMQVGLRRLEKTGTFRVAELVASAFLGPCPENNKVCFVDGNRRNVGLHNLKYDVPRCLREHGKRLCRRCGEQRNPSDFIERRVYKRCDQCRSGETLERREQSIRELLSSKPPQVSVEVHRQRSASRASSRRRREAVLKVYGGYCQCCGETRYEFLAIDHINGGGNEHRRQMNSPNIYPWLVKNKYPEGFQVLCHNCNIAKSFYGECPHRAEVKKYLHAA